MAITLGQFSTSANQHKAAFPQFGNVEQCCCNGFISGSGLLQNQQEMIKEGLKILFLYIYT